LPAKLAGLRSVTRCCARPYSRRSPSRGGASCTGRGPRPYRTRDRRARRWRVRLAGADLEAVPQLVRAAADARAVAALDQAVAFLQEALAIAPDRAEEWLELGELEAWRANRDGAELAFGRALGLLEASTR
jgi:tetratricopeptide (TPR) repeat protein